MPTGSASWLDALPPALDHVIACIAPSRVAGDDHRSTYPEAVRGALMLAAQRQCRSILYTSSTGVYGRTDGGVSRETDRITVHDDRQAALLEAEDALADASAAGGVGRTVLRVAGLYGPGRDPAPRFRVAIPAGEADVWCNFAWRDDVVAAIIRLLTMPADPGTRRVLNCADGTPLRASSIARALGAPEAASSPAPAGGRSNQQIPVEALRATGWSPSMPTVFDGLAALGHHVDASVVRHALRTSSPPGR